MLGHALVADRAKLFRRFLRLRRSWKARTRREPTVAPLEEPRFVNLEPAPVTRTGLGFDLHPLADGRALVLGGITVPAARAVTESFFSEALNFSRA